MRRFATITLLVTLCVVFTSLLPTRAVADEPEIIGQACFVSSDHANRALARAACDLKAEEHGFTHGVLIPCNSSANEICPVKCAQHVGHYCVGVTPKPTSE